MRFDMVGRMSADDSTRRKIKRALISVYDKSGIVDFARTLVDEFGIDVVSTGGTAKLLKDSGLPVTLVEDVTGSGEMLDGRVKTLHPKIHAAILADRDNPEHMRRLKDAGIDPIDMVVVNLYPFDKTIAKPASTFDEAIEMIDIGGPCMLRAAAKNHRHVLPVLSQRRFGDVLAFLGPPNAGDSDANLRLELAGEVFRALSGYDACVGQFLGGHWASQEVGLGQEDVDAILHPMAPGPAGYPKALRYGENPHQRSQCLIGGPSDVAEACLAAAALRGATAMSFNNYADAGAALELCKELTRGLGAPGGTRGKGATGRYACVFVKHMNPCGVGVSDDPLEAYRSAYLGDPNAAMGGVLVCSSHVTSDFAALVMDTYDRWGRSAGAGGFFVEVWIAPSFEVSAIETVRNRKKWGTRVRLAAVGDMDAPPDGADLDCRKIVGGMLVQTRDLIGLNEDEWEPVTRGKPSESELADLRLAWLVCKHTRSNAITICRDGMLLGNGAGQMSRVMSCRIATWAAKENGHGEALLGSVAASDAFFPFRDGPDLLLDAGVRAIIQPGGSKRDAETIAACDERGVAMIFTDTRHFRH